MSTVLRILVAMGALAGAGILMNHHRYQLGRPISRQAIHDLARRSASGGEVPRISGGAAPRPIPARRWR